MNFQSLRELLEKIPVMLVLIAYLGYVGYGYYTFQTDPSSELNQAKQQVVSARQELDALRAKIKKVQDFSRTLDLKKAELRGLAEQLENTRATLPEQLDIPDIMKTLLIEAKRTGLTVTSLKPGEIKKKEYYGEQVIKFSSTGIYFQYIAFLDRLASLQKIIRTVGFSFEPISSPTDKYVQLQSEFKFKAYHYIGSKADQLGKNATATSGGTKPASTGSGR